ncbi:hypothetical protein, partial [Xanthomonas citri]|uniref:hypothetical protein n=1 Tax=Xanthomonas citri TaxID=346 RepID=UPI001A8C1E55
ATGDGADALYALPRERFAHGKQLSWLRDRANQESRRKRFNPPISVRSRRTLGLIAPVSISMTIASILHFK